MKKQIEAVQAFADRHSLLLGRGACRAAGRCGWPCITFPPDH